jgi:magnesium-transporting ATPase (P-type)
MQRIEPQSKSGILLSFGFASAILVICAIVIAGLSLYVGMPNISNAQEEEHAAIVFESLATFIRTAVIVIISCLLSFILAVIGLLRKEKRVLPLAAIALNVILIIIALISILGV